MRVRSSTRRRNSITNSLTRWSVVVPRPATSMAVQTKRTCEHVANGVERATSGHFQVRFYYVRITPHFIVYYIHSSTMMDPESTSHNGGRQHERVRQNMFAIKDKGLKSPSTSAFLFHATCFLSCTLLLTQTLFRRR